TWTVVRSTTDRPVTQWRFIGRMEPTSLCGNDPYFAINRRPSPSIREISAPATSSNRAALSAMAPSADWRSVGELEIIRSTSEVAVSRSSASSRSRRSRTTSVSWPEADELLWRTAFGAFALRLRALASLLLALERRRIAHPKGLGLRRFSKCHYSRDLRPVEWG